MKFRYAKNRPRYRANRIAVLGKTPILVHAAALFFLLASCVEEPQEVQVGAGNYCSLTGKVVWASSRGNYSQGDTETYNIFLMDDDGNNIEQLTSDAWPVINQHPVFTPDCKQVVWRRGGRIWIMNLDGSDKTELSSSPPNEEDGHPWVGADNRIYFARHEVVSGAHGRHRIWRMDLDGMNQVELITTPDKDLFHPNLRQDKESVLYTSGSPGTGIGDEIRVFSQVTNEDEVLYAPGWPVSAATWHPEGNKIVVAEDHDNDGRYRIVEIEYPGGGVLQTFVETLDNTVPYYAHPSGEFVDWVRWPGDRRARDIWRVNTNGNDMANLTNDPHDDLEIVGEIELVPTTGECIPRPVGCYPTPPPCKRVVLPDAIEEDLIELGTAVGKILLAQQERPDIAAEEYLAFLTSDLNEVISSADESVTSEMRGRAGNILEFLSVDVRNELRQRAADFYVNALFIGLE